ncbi:MAG: alpha/beta hydrolase [Anaerolineae bacterium]|nr:alpha/beta hydrolase [Anaerolineae bacterium]
MTVSESLKPHNRWPSYVLLAVMILLLLMTIGALLYTFSSNASPAANTAMQGGPQVQVSTTSGFISFAPAGSAVDASKASTGFILYPGAFVDATAYALFASAIAASGYPVFVTPMPLDLAVMNPNAAQVVIDTHPEITNWVIGGHSLGGAMAGQFVAAHPDQISGLVLFGAYPNADLSGWNGIATSVYGTNDGIATSAQVQAAANILPAGTTFVPIEGGNHAQFGDYGAQGGDNPATISAAEQLAQAAQATLNVLNQVNAGNQG